MPQTTGQEWTPQRIVRVIHWCALAVTLAGLWWSASTAVFILRAETTEATLVDWDVVTSKGRNSSGMSETHHFWHAIVEVRDASGAVHRARSPRGINQRRWETGAQVPVYYDARNPAQIFIRDAFDIWFPPAIISAVGLLALLTTSAVLHLLRVQAQARAADVADIVSRHVTKKQPMTTLPEAPRFVTFPKPPGETFAYTPYCDSTDLDTELAAELKKHGSDMLMVVRADEQNLILQTPDRARYVPRADIREVSIYPVLPAKACGHVQMNLEMVAEDNRNYFEFFMCGPHNEAVLDWCMDKAAQIASMLSVPVKLLEPGHDC